MNQKHVILLPFLLLIMMGSAIVFLHFPQLADRLHYANTQYFFIEHLFTVVAGVGFLYLMYTRGDEKWFDLTGATALGIALLLMVVTLFFSEQDDSGRRLLSIGHVAVDALPLFMLDVIWLIDFAHRHPSVEHQWLRRGFYGVVLLFWVYASLMYLPSALLLGVTVLCILFCIYRSTKVVLTFVTFFAALVTLILWRYSYRMERIGHWVEVVIHGRKDTPHDSLTHLIMKLHDGLFIFNDWGMLLFLLVGSLFVSLIVLLWKSHDRFAQSVAILFMLDMIFHFIVVMNWTGIRAPTVWIVEQGVGVVIASFLMMGMILVRFKKYDSVMSTKR